MVDLTEKFYGLFDIFTNVSSIMPNRNIRFLLSASNMGPIFGSIIWKCSNIMEICPSVSLNWNTGSEIKFKTERYDIICRPVSRCPWRLSI